MLDKKVVKEGTLILRDGTVYVGHDWDLSQPGMCREHAIAACLHTAQKLTQAAIDIIADPWYPTAALRWSSAGRLQQKFSRRCFEAYDCAIYGGHGYRTREFLEFEWRDVPTESSEPQQPKPTSGNSDG